MNVYLVAFLLGLSPNTGEHQEIANQWNSLNQEEQTSLLNHFQEEYGVKPSDLTEQQVKDFRRVNYRTWDRME